MSTYYYFCCLKCQVKGGCFTRQAWGWGNFDIIDSFKFLAYHVSTCGAENIRIVSEHDLEDLPNCNLSDEMGVTHREEFLENARDYFPHSDDWKFMRENSDNQNALWTDWARR